MDRRSVLLGGLAALAAGAAAAQSRPVVVAVNYPLAFFADRLAGGAAEVRLPVPPGTDPQFWRPRVADIGAIQAADLILLNGAGFAAWTARASLPRSRSVDTSRAFRDRLIATEGLVHSHGEGGEHAHDATAAFTWLDQSLAAEQARAVAAGLARVLPGEAAAIETRLQALLADLAALDAEAKALTPLAEGRAIIATHPRYQYLARAYGLSVHALEWDAGAAPDAGQLADLKALAARTGAAVLIWEAAPPAEARAAVAALGLADTVFPTLAMPPDAGDYASAFREAVAGLAAALSR